MANARNPQPPAASSPRNSSAYALAAVLLFALALGVRVPLIEQSLWYDEMYTLLHYAGQPFSTILTNYSPNNHPLYSLLAHLSILVGGVNDAALRLPAILCGCLIGIALAWPLRKDRPLLALIVALLAALQPWLAAFSAEGRGYTLLLLLSILATHRLTVAIGKIDWLYILLVAAAVYAMPIAVALVVGHGVAALLLHRKQLGRWLASASIAGAIILLLYLPFASSMVAYLTRPRRPSMPYAQFLADLPRYLLIGWTPRQGDPFSPNLPSILAWLAVGGVIIAGSILAWRRRVLLVEGVTFASATLLTLLAPLLLADAGEVRFAVWIIPLFILALALLLTPPPNASRKLIRLAAALVMIACSAIPLAGLWSIPAQPVWEAIATAQDRTAQSGGAIVGIYLGSAEAREVYRPDPPLLATYSLEGLQRLERESRPPLWALVFYEPLLARDHPEILQHVQAHYQLVQTFPGRISPVKLYRRMP